MYRINQVVQRHQSFYRCAVPGFNRNGHLWKLRQFLLANISRGGVIESKLSHDFSSAIQHEHVVMVLGPVEPGEVRDVLPCFHLS